jgi:hypothetical protein
LKFGRRHFGKALLHRDSAVAKVSDLSTERRLAVGERANLRILRERLHDVGDFLAEAVGYVPPDSLRVLDSVVQEPGRNDGFRVPCVVQKRGYL